MEYLSNFEFMRPIIDLFGYIYDWFYIFMEIAKTPTIEVQNHLLGFTTWEIVVDNIFTYDITTYAIDFGFLGNQIITSLIDILNGILSFFTYDSLLTKPFYITILIGAIPITILFWFIGIVQKLIKL